MAEQQAAMQKQQETLDQGRQGAHRRMTVVEGSERPPAEEFRGEPNAPSAPPPPPGQYGSPPGPYQNAGWQPQYPPQAGNYPSPGPPPHQFGSQQPGFQPPYGTGPNTHWGPPPKKPTPTWLLSLIFALIILGVGGALYFGLQRFGKTNPQEKAGLENPANPSKARVSNPLQKYVEVVGIRLMSDAKKRPVAKFLVVNHSSTSIDGLAANVTLWASTSRSEEDSVASFSFKLTRLGPEESRELTEPLKTKLKLYELPDWQNANADIQITAP